MSDMPLAQTIEERAIELFRAHFGVLNKPDLTLSVAIRFLVDRKFHFLPVPNSLAQSGCIFGGRIITPQLSWNGSAITFYLSVDALPIAALNPIDAAKGHWAAIKRSQYGDEESGVGILYLE